MCWNIIVAYQNPSSSTISSYIFNLKCQNTPKFEFCDFSTLVAHEDPTTRATDWYHCIGQCDECLWKGQCMAINFSIASRPDFWWKKKFSGNEMRWDEMIYIYIYIHDIYMNICIFVYMFPLFPLYIMINLYVYIYIYLSWYTFRWYTVNTTYPHQPDRFANKSSPVSGHKTNGVNIILYNSSISACAKSDVWQATGRSWGV